VPGVLDSDGEVIPSIDSFEAVADALGASDATDVSQAEWPRKCRNYWRLTRRRTCSAPRDWSRSCAARMPERGSTDREAGGSGSFEARTEPFIRPTTLPPDMNEADVRERLVDVRDPDLGDDIVSLGLVNDVEVDDDEIRISLALGAPFSPHESAIADDVRAALADTGLDVELSASIPDDLEPDEQVLPGVKNVIAVASGKGGVGKSTMAVNIAAGLSALGARVGLFDADVYGPNVPRMVSAEERPQTDGETIVPPERFGVKLMSMDFLTWRGRPVIWRGPMVHKIITQLVRGRGWGELDYLVMDLPPGTGDTQLTILQTLPS